METYITTESLKDTLSLSSTMFADPDIELVIGSASRTVERLCNRRFYADADAQQARYYSPEGRGWLEIADLAEFTSLQTDADGDGVFEQTWTENIDFVLEPLDARDDANELGPYTSILVHPAGSYLFPTAYPRSVKLTGKFGWPAVPANVVQATTLLANRLLTVTRSAPLGIVAFDGGAIRVARADSQVMMLIGDYIRHRVAVA